MALISIINVCQLSDSEDSIESWIDDIMKNADDGELQESVSKDLFVENAMKLKIIQHSLQKWRETFRCYIFEFMLDEGGNCKWEIVPMFHSLQLMLKY